MFMSGILVIHICFSVIALLAGAAAMLFKKGSRFHRKSGNIFVISMLIMAVSAAYLALIHSIYISVFASGLTIYMVTTAWVAVRYKIHEAKLFNWAALLFGIVISICYLSFGFDAVTSSSGAKGGFPAGVYFFFGGIAALAVLRDIRMFMLGSFTRVQMMARHIWRMCFALFIATASLFLGQPQVFPEPVRKIAFLVIPVLIVIILSIFWLYRALFTNLYKRRLA